MTLSAKKKSPIQCYNSNSSQPAIEQSIDLDAKRNNVLHALPALAQLILHRNNVKRPHPIRSIAVMAPLSAPAPSADDGPKVPLPATSQILRRSAAAADAKAQDGSESRHARQRHPAPFRPAHNHVCQPQCLQDGLSYQDGRAARRADASTGQERR